MSKAIVIGGGVAGPATALFLRRAGWDCEIYEARATPDPYGGLFLNVATNGLAVLEQLELRARLLEDVHPCPYMVMLGSRGKPLGIVPNGPAGQPERGSVIARRAWLHQVLGDAVRDEGIPMNRDARIIDIEDGQDRVRATFADGSHAEGDVLIGCDGVGSVIRRWIDPAAPEPEYTGLVSVGGFAHVPGLEPTPETQTMVFGARSFFGYLVREDGTVYWFANLTTPEPSRDALRDVPSGAWLAQLGELHADDPYPVPQILAGVVEGVGAYPIYDLAHVPSWHRGRVVGAGDAMHATSPSAGQGASLALEDAISLARCLRDHGRHQDA
ncbi:MAG: FAD-dependent monooxygenase, partial [Thermomicrobiales bacterium]